MVEVGDRLTRRGCLIEELCQVASEGNLEAVIRLLSLGAELDGARHDGCTPLQRASCEGHIDVVKHLIECGANTNTQDPLHGNTPLHEASWKGFSETADNLVNAKADVDIRNICGFAPLHLACQNGHNQTCRVLLLGGAKPDMKNNYGDTPLHTAARYGHAGVTRILLSANANVKEVNKNGDTALHIATAMGRKKLTKMLLEASSDQTIKNKQNETSLDIAIRKGFTDVIDILCNPPPIITPDERRRIEMQQNNSEVKNDSTRKDKRRIKITDSGASSKDSGTKKKEKKKLKGESKIHPKTRESRILNWGVEWSPYGCHVASPSEAKITSAKLKTMPSNPLSSGEQYFVDLAGNIRKGPVGVGSSCFCAPLFESVQDKMDRDKIDIMDHIDAAHGKLGERISSLETHTRGQIQELGDCFHQKITEESEKCRLRSSRIERSHEIALSDTVSEMKSWVESRLSFHHPDSPKSFRGKTYLGKSHSFGNSDSHLKRSKSVETFSEILQPTEEPLYKGLCVLDYPTSMYNIPHNVGINDKNASPYPYMNEPHVRRKQTQSKKSLCPNIIITKEPGLSSDDRIFNVASDCGELQTDSTEQTINNGRCSSGGGNCKSDVCEPTVYLQSYKSGLPKDLQENGYNTFPENSYMYNYRQDCLSQVPVDIPLCSREGFKQSHVRLDHLDHEQEHIKYLSADRFPMETALRKVNKRCPYENNEKVKLDETSIEFDSHNDSGYSTRLCSASQGPSPSLAYAAPTLLKSQLYKTGPADIGNDPRSRWSRSVLELNHAHARPLINNEMANGNSVHGLMDRIGKSSLV